MSKVFGDPDAMRELSDLGWQGLLQVIWSNCPLKDVPTSKSGPVAQGPVESSFKYLQIASGHLFEHLTSLL